MILNLLISIVVLLLCWAIAYLLAVPVAYLVKRTKLEKLLTLASIPKFSPNNRVRLLRVLIFVGILAILDLTLAALTGITPIHVVWKNSIQNFVDFELTQAVLSSLLYNLVLFLGIFIIYQTTGLINELFPRIYEIIHEWRYTRFHVVRIKNLELLTPDQITNVIVSLTRYFQIGLNLAMVAVAVTFGLSFFPGTQGIIFYLLDRFVEILEDVWATVVEFLPNLFTLVMIVVFTHYTLKLLHFFYEGVKRGRIKIAGLHPELAEPTYQLLRFFVLALALVAAYPFIPGSDSPVFRGITIFVGFLLSLGSTSLVTNIVSGIVLTYTRGLRIGDRVKIGDTIGDVVERTMLITRVRTIKNVIITIPNGMVLNNEIINFSSNATHEGLILHTTITIGYDVPWRQVHDLLTQAALSTRDILKRPEPFVLQTSLDDYYVSYELNVYTKKPERMAVIFSELHQNIQDWFNQGGVEIMSPAYTAFRDGNKITIPAQYRGSEPDPGFFNRFPKVDTVPVSKK